MNKTLLMSTIIIMLLAESQAFSQLQDLPKFEVAAEFTTLEREQFSIGRRTEPGFGGRFTYNLNRVFSLETAGYFFPKRCFDCLGVGRTTEVLGGVKVGKRFDSWGIFAKARPGVVHFTNGDINAVVICLNDLCPFPIEDTRVKKNIFATDIGGVIEFYPSKRIVTRFDAGDTIIHFTRRVTKGLQRDRSTGRFIPFEFIRPAMTTHNFQFVASVGFCF